MNKKMNKNKMRITLENLQWSRQTIRKEYAKHSEFYAYMKDLYDANALSAINYSPVITGATNKLHDTFDVIERNSIKYRELLCDTQGLIYSLAMVVDEYERVTKCLSILSTVNGVYYLTLQKLLVEKDKMEVVMSALHVNSKNTVISYRDKSLNLMCNLYNLECDTSELFDFARNNLEMWMEV